MYSDAVAGGWKERKKSPSPTLASGNTGKVRLTRCNAATQPESKLLRADKVVVGSGPNARKAIRNPKALIQAVILRSSSPLIKRKPSGVKLSSAAGRREIGGVTLSAASVKPRVTIVQPQRRPAWGAINGLANFGGPTKFSEPKPRTTMRSALITQPPKPALFTQRQKIKSAGTLRAPLRLTLAASVPARSSVRITGSGVSAGVLRDRRVMLPKKQSLVKHANLKSETQGHITTSHGKLVLRKKMTPSSRLVKLLPRRREPDDSDKSRAASNVAGSPPSSPAHGTMRYQPPRSRSPTPRARSDSPAALRDTSPPAAAGKKDNQSRSSSRPLSSLSPSARRKTKKHDKERRSRSHSRSGSRSRSRSSSSTPAGAHKRSSDDAKRSAPRRVRTERTQKLADEEKQQARKKEQEREAEKLRAAEKEKLRQKDLQKKKEEKLKELKFAKEREKLAREKERDRKAEKERGRKADKEKEARERSLKRRRSSVQKSKREAEKQKRKKMSRKRARSESSSDSSDSSSSESSRKKKKKRSETPRKRPRTPKPGYLGVCVRFLARDGIRAFPNRTRLRDILTYFKKHWHLNGDYEFKDKDPIARLETLVNELKTRDGHIVLRMVKA